MFSNIKRQVAFLFVGLILLLTFPLFFTGIGIAGWLENLFALKVTKTTLAIHLVTVASVLGIGVTLLLCRFQRKGYMPSCRELLSIGSVGAAVLFLFDPHVYEAPHLIPASYFSCMAILMALYALFRWGALLIWGLLLLISALKIAFFHNYGTPLNAYHLQEALRANSTEIINFLTLGNVAMLVVVLLVVVVLLWGYYRSMRQIASLPLLSAACCSMALFGVSLMLMPSNRANITALWPLYEVRNTMELFGKAQEQDSRIFSRIEKLPSPADAPSEMGAIHPNDAAVVILHIGESVRSDRLGLNGWKNNNTPRLAERKELINFSKCISEVPSTCATFISILTNGTGNIQQEIEDDTLPTVGNVADFFVEHGFKTAAFLHRSNVPDIKEVSMSTKSFNCTFAYIFNKLFQRMPERYYIDNKSMEQSYQIVKYCSEHQDKNLFLFVNNMGSHGPFADYEHENPAFTPTNHVSFYTNAQDHAEAVSNAYDNTIAYQDAFIGNIMDQLKGRPFVYIYIGDHGECLGEDGLWSRAALPSESYYCKSPACVVPLLIAYSPEFAMLHPHLDKSLQQLRKNTQMTIGHGHLFHTLLGLFDIKTPHYKEEWDLSSEKARAYTGTRPDGI